MAKAARNKRWLHPQTVPRGFLRLYVLTSLSRGPTTGYALIRDIDVKTEGAWRPGPGTIYPLLRSLESEGLTEGSGEKAGPAGKLYALSPKGRHELERMRNTIAAMGSKERVLFALFSDIIPGRIYVPMMVKRMREGMEVFRSKVREMPEPDKEATLKELRLVMESQTGWIDSELARSRKPTRRARHP